MPRLAPFRLNKITDFEEDVPLTEFYRGQFLPPIDNKIRFWVEITNQKAHSGKHSLRLNVQSGEGEKILPLYANVGQSMWLNAGVKHRLTAWALYDGKLPASIRISATQIYFSLEHPLRADETKASISEPEKWFPLQLEFTPVANDPAAVLQFFITGNGSIYLDDLIIEEVR